MGMSASQLRYCLISGKKSDVEFEGQQINQQRTTLATETSTYNSQLLDLKVPTAPSADSYTKTSYTFDMGGNNYSIKGVTYVPANGTYTINTTNTIVGSAAQTGLALFNSFTANGNTTYTTGTTASTQTNLTLIDLATEDAQTQALDRTNMTLIYGKDFDQPTYTITAGGIALNSLDTSNTATATALQTVYGTNYNANTKYYSYNTTNGGNNVTHYVAATDINATTHAATSYVAGTAAIPGAGGNGTALALTQSPAETYYKYQSNGTTRYITGTTLAANANQGTNAKYSYVNDTATITQSSSFTNATVAWDSSGRMTGFTDSDGTLHSLTSSTKTDETAYSDAMNQYAYDKQIYEQKNNEINAKISVVQMQDKKLELKLQNLDTQQQALSTEMESVKKVIDKNIEASFKAFG